MADKYKNGSQRKKILSKASALFWDKGYTETSMKDIAGACGFRPANIYNFFENKEKILFEILREEMEEIISPLRSLENDTTLSPVEALRKIITHHVHLTLGEKRSSRLLFDSGLNNLSPKNRKKITAMRDHYNRIGEAVIQRGIDQGLFTTMDAKLTVYSVASLIARSRLWYSPRGKYSIDEIIDFICTFTLRGLGAA